MLTEIVVDRRVLNSFKRRILKVYPKEYAEYAVGRLKDNLCGDTSAHIFYFRPPNYLKSDLDSVCYTDDNEECGDSEDTPLRVLGFIHSHPDATPDLSDVDQALLNDAQDEFWGVCGVRKTAKKRMVSWGFYTPDGHPIHLVISE